MFSSPSTETGDEWLWIDAAVGGQPQHCPVIAFDRFDPDVTGTV